jgi:hypothetical protein
MRGLIKIGFIIGIVAVLVWLGLGIYSSISSSNQSKGPELPKMDQAKYAFTVSNSGTVFLSNNYEQFGQAEGARTFLLHGFWDVNGSGKDFKWNKGDLPLDEKVWGKISIIVRRASSD